MTLDERDAEEVEETRAEIQKGSDSGASIPADKVFSEVRERIAKEGLSRTAGK